MKDKAKVVDQISFVLNGRPFDPSKPVLLQISPEELKHESTRNSSTSKPTSDCTSERTTSPKK